MLAYAQIDNDRRICRMYDEPNESFNVINIVNNPEYVLENFIDDIKDFVLTEDGNAKYSPSMEKMQSVADKEVNNVYSKQLDVVARMFVNSQVSVMSYEQMLEVKMLFDEWTIGHNYSTGDVVRYSGGLYQALQNSIAQEIYPPDTYTSGWKRIGEPNEEGIYPWSQPLGATDAYKLGYKVSHKGKTWESTIANGVWEPGVYGWKEVEDSGQTEPTDPDEPVENEYPEWVQPTGAHDAYSIGDKVTYNDRHWVSNTNGNVWVPGEYGWDEVV